MRVAAIAIVFALTFTAAASAATVLADDPKPVASVTAPAERTAGSASVAVATNTAWYRDPITITLALVGLFALIDLSLLLTQHRHRTDARALRQQRSDYTRA